MSKSMSPINRNWLLAFTALAIAVGGYVFDGYQKAHPRPSAKVGVGITGYNFTEEGVQSFSVNASGGSNLPPYGGGGKTSCCILVPEKWTPDLTATVDWTIGHYDLPLDKILPMSAEEVHKHFVKRTLQKTVPIERYETPGRVQVFFLPHDEIRVFSSDIGLGNHNDHPSGMHSPRDPRPAPQETQP